MPPKRDQRKKYTQEQRDFLKQYQPPELFPRMDITPPSVDPLDESLWIPQRFRVTQKEKAARIKKYSDRFLIRPKEQITKQRFLLIPAELSQPSTRKKQQKLPVKFDAAELQKLTEQALAESKSQKPQDEEEQNNEQQDENYDDEEDEEENDYGDTYFDNGEGYDEDSGGENEATYS